ncbi:Alpha/Beta hydrolase protein [Absidia repens]|uniref:Alpha/Beta hydrolase protein n=1 Tax=Absidia repens TaxID=90262 RepID=A0A1X2I995_9FUNG|nr:Alpha/Beta hydrolase protein [Absidia repens]
MLALLASYGYFLWALVGVFFNIDTFYPHKVADLLFHHRSRLGRPILTLLEVHVSIRAEMPLQLFVLKVFAIALTGVLGGFDYWLTWVTLCVLDIPNLLVCLYLFWEMVQEKQVYLDALQQLDSSMQINISSNIKWLLRILVNPLWRPPNITVFPDITYATHEELMEAIQPTDDLNEQKRLQLDVYTTNPPTAGSSHILRPVLVHIHGGGWQQGTNKICYPFEKMLLSEQNWIVVNIAYRLAPKHPYPAHLYDVKRALRWVKTSIHSYGGDPDFVVLSGDSSGGHLAAMAAVTANEPEWQPGFESIDTSVCGVISLNGSLDIQGDESKKAFFTHKVAGLDELDQAFLDRHSPLQRVEKQLAGKQLQLPPFFVLASQRDAMVNASIGVNFKAVFYEQESNPDDGCTLLVLPGAHHACYVFWSLRSFYGSQVIQAWCKRLYSNSSRYRNSA